MAYEKRVDPNVWSELKLLRRTLINTNDDWANFGSPSKGRRMTFQGLEAAFASPTTNPSLEAGRPQQSALALLHRWERHSTELRQASKRPYARLELEIPIVRRFSFPDMSLVEWTNVPSGKGLFVLAEVSIIHGVAALSDGSPQDAIADAAIIFKLADALKDNSNLDSKMYRGYIVNVFGTGLFWEGFVQHLWAEEHLLIFQNQFQSIDLIGDVDAGFRAREWLNVFNAMDRFAIVSQIYGPLHPIFSEFFGGEVLRHRWMRDFIFTSYDIKQGLIFPRATEANDAAYRLDSKGMYEDWGLAGMFVQDFARDLRLAAHYQTTVRLATLACALECHQKSSGRYPERLEELMPEFIQKVPHEVVNGKPFKYRRLEDGTFTLYSVGWDEHDDGGVASTEKNGKETGDWVWFYAAVEPK